jgi:hypothetical protein
MSHYQLAGPPGWTTGSSLLTPHPDWFTSVLFKQLTGDTALAAAVTSTDPALDGNVLVYAWCSGAQWWDNMSMVVSWVNPTGVDVNVSLSTPNVTSVPRYDFTLTSSAEAYHEHRARMAGGRPLTSAAPLDPPASLQDDAVYMNGVLLAVDANGVLPWPNGAIYAGREVTDPAEGVTFPPYSYGFIEYTGPGPHGGCS